MQDGAFAEIRGDDPSAPASEGVENSPLFRCEICHRDFEATDVFDAQGRIICKSCYGGLPTQSTSATSEHDKTTLSVTPGKDGTRVAAHRSPPKGLLPRITCPRCWN